MGRPKNELSDAPLWIPIERGKALHGLIGQWRFEAMKGVGNMPQLEAPERMLAALSDFYCERAGLGIAWNVSYEGARGLMAVLSMPIGAGMTAIPILVKQA